MKRYVTVATAVFALACGGATDVVAPPAPAVLTTLTVSLSVPSIQVGQTATASVAGTDQRGTPIATGPVTWAASAGASVAEDGRVTGVAPGAATIIATAGGKTAQAMLTVTALPAVGLALKTPPSAVVASRVAIAQQPVVQVVNASGGAVAQAGVVVTAAVPSGSLSGSVTATTDAQGIATFADLTLTGAAGLQTLSFTAPGLTGATAAVMVLAGAPATVVLAGGMQQTATAGTGVPTAPSIRVADADGNPVAGVAVAFDVTGGSGSVTGSPAITNASGIATLGSWTLGAVGTNTLMAHVVGSAVGVSIAATATAPAPVLTTLRVAVSPATILVGQTAQAVAYGTDQYGADIATGAITWSSSSPATVAQSGTITGVAAGVATVTATAGGRSAQATVTVTAPPVPVLTTLTVVATPAALQVGQSAQAAAYGKDQFGADIATGAVVWTATGAVTVTSAGVLTGVSVGQGTVTATVGGVTAQTVVSVSEATRPAPVLTTLSVRVAPSALQQREVGAAAAFGRDQYGDDIATGAVAWSASGAVSVSSSGLVTGISAGQGTVSATAGGLTAQTTVTVTAPPVSPVLTSLQITATPASIQVGGTSQAVVVARDQFGAAIATGPVVWSATGAATVSSTGLVTGVSAGQATITATAGGISAQTTVAVTSAASTTPVLTTLRVTLSPSDINVKEQSQATAEGFDQYGAPISTGPVTFSSPGNENSVLAISPSGLITTWYGGADQAPIIATAGNVTGRATLTVRYLATIAVTVEPNVVLVGGTTQATVVARDQFGAPTRLYHLSVQCAGLIGSQNCPGRATITPDGLITGVTPGSVQVLAMGDYGQGLYYVAATAGLIVTTPFVPALADFTVTVPATLAVGQTVHLDVQGKDQRGGSFSLGRVEYYSDPPRVASIDQFGNLTGVNPGTTIVYIRAFLASGASITKQYTVVVPGTPTSKLSANAPPTTPIPNQAVFPVPPQIVLVDEATGERIPQNAVPVTATLTSGGGTLSGTTTRPTSFGSIQFTDLKVRGASGPKTITFTAPGYNPTTWQFTLGPAAPAIITVNGGNNQSAAAGSLVAVNPSVKVTDIDGNPVSGVAVNFVVTAGGGGVTPGSIVTTDANGIAQVAWRLGTAGSNTLTATAAGVGTPVTFTATATAGVQQSSTRTR